MSAFSYIAFGREADTSCIKSRFDKTKAYMVGEIRGTDLEKKWEEQFGGRFADLPDNAGVYFGDWESDFHGIAIMDKYDAIFNGVFTNQFIYGFEGSLGIHSKETLATMRGDLQGADLDYINKLIESGKKNVAICRQQLYALVMLNAAPGEIVEIYTDWVDHRNIFVFGPPENEIVISANSIITSDVLDLRERTKIVIERTDC